MKCLSIESLMKYELTSEEKFKIFAGDPIAKPNTEVFGGPDTDGEEDCLPPPPGEDSKDKCYEYKVFSIYK
ncbi:MULTISPECIES: hypothetical protein [Tenacibaculum]|uniref:Uncharacterized protein n=1 Tax=Tenacibaculum discolor TaxID=361581 RepID=A0A2G1BXC8_9FLAO|nr:MULTISPECIES: hypothetical protein [Tenacibaculum]MDP2540756.1 hypothetical protein [Tenacibaculum discolor]NVK07692.1 hypothetical protein [Tenacibaculum sp.]PHN98711.1 hypothetical protein CSC81_04240 [Tenacibaculum discolor]RLK02204.1 hypothetical protein C8N27_1337 [Tenacibaculum discolor]